MEITKEMVIEEINNVINGFNPVENNRTNIINAELTLGKFFALMELLFKIDVNAYVELADSTKEQRDMLFSITEKIYKL